MYQNNTLGFSISYTVPMSDLPAVNEQLRFFVENFCDFVNFSRLEFHRLRMNEEIERTPLRSAAHLLVRCVI